jgi:hypothetical protein
MNTGGEMLTKQLLRKVDRNTAEYRSTYTLNYRYEMPDRVFYFDDEAVENIHLANWKGHVVEVCGSAQFGGSISPNQKTLLKSAIARGTLEKYNTVFVFEYDVTYE